MGPAVGQCYKPDSEHPVTGRDPETGRGERTTGAGGGKDSEQRSLLYSQAGCVWRVCHQQRVSDFLEFKVMLSSTWMPFLCTLTWFHPFPSQQHRRQQQELLKLQQQQALQMAQQPQAKLSGWGSVAKQPAITKSLLEIQREEAQQMKQRKEQQQPQQHPTVTQQTRNQSRNVRDP